MKEFAKYILPDLERAFTRALENQDIELAKQVIKTVEKFKFMKTAEEMKEKLDTLK